MPSTSSLPSITRLNSTVVELITYLFDLSPLERDSFFTLMKAKKGLTLDHCANKLDRDRTTLFRCLDKLVKSGICVKETKALKEGGYYHVYSAIDKQTFKLEVERRIREIQESFDRIIKKFEDDIDKAVASF